MTIAPAPADHTLAYAPKEGSSRFFIYYLVYYLITLIPVGLSLVGLLLVTPSFKAVFMSFKTTLPFPALMLITASDIARSGYWVLAVLILFVLPIFLARSTVRQPLHVQRVSCVMTYAALMLFLTLSLTLLSAAALGFPLFKLVQSII